MFRFTRLGENSHQERIVISFQFCCKFTSVSVSQNYQNIRRFDKVIAKIKGAMFLPDSVFQCNLMH